jgi:hypothetical protein
MSFVGVGAFAQKSDPRHHVVVVDELAVFVPDGLGELAQADFRALLDDRDVFHADRSSILGRDDRVPNVLHVLHETHFLNTSTSFARAATRSKIPRSKAPC